MTTRSLVNALATRQQKQVAGVIAAIAFLAFLVTAPFVRIPLAQMPAFISSYQAAIFFIDLITAARLSSCLSACGIKLAPRWSAKTRKPSSCAKTFCIIGSYLRALAQQ